MGYSEARVMKAEKQTTWRFDSVDEFGAYVRDHPEALGISPGGAAARLGVGRQRVYDLIKAGKLRAWFVYDCQAGSCYDVPGNKASFVFVSAEDVERYGVTPRSKGGRPRKQEVHASVA
jgi:hypothetical protein